MSDDQSARTRVLWTLVVRFAWEAQESARAGAKYISIVVLYICCCSDAKLVGRDRRNHMGREDQSDQQRHKS